MSKDESIRDKEQMARIIAFELCPQKYHKEWYGEYARCYAGNNYRDCATIKKVVDKLYNEKYRKLVEDEIVIKKSEYDTLLKGYTLIYDNAYQWGLKVGEEKAAIEILQELKDRQTFMLADEVFGRETVITQKINELAEKYGIELED